MPGRLNARGIFDPRFTDGMAFVADRSRTSQVLVRRRKAGIPGEPTFDFDAGIRPGASLYETVWEGPARVQPNQDWRARSYTFAGETTVFQAVAFKLPLADGVWRNGHDHFLDEDQVLITYNFFPALEPIKKFVYTVRNPLVSGNAPEASLLCDVDLKSGFNLGNS